MTDTLTGPVPLFHRLFANVKDTLHDDFPAPGVAKIVKKENIFDGASKSQAINVCFSSDGSEHSMTASHRVKLRGNDIIGGVQYTRGCAVPLSPFVQFTCPKEKHTCIVNKDRVVYQFANSTFAAYARSNFWSGGAPVHGSITACIRPDVFAGVCFDYDALRSGLRSTTAAVNFTRGDVEATVSMNGRCESGLCLQWRPRPNVRVLADVLKSQRTCVVGVEHASPCGRRSLLRVDVVQRLVSVASFFNVSGWDVGASATVGRDSLTAPRFGFTLSA